MDIYFKVHNPLKHWRAGDPPLSPEVSIGLTRVLESETGEPLLTCGLATEREVDLTINMLIEELERIRKAAKLKLRRMHEKMITKSSV